MAGIGSKRSGVRLPLLERASVAAPRTGWYLPSGHARAVGTPLLHDPPVFSGGTATIQIDDARCDPAAPDGFHRRLNARNPARVLLARDCSDDVRRAAESEQSRADRRGDMVLPNGVLPALLSGCEAVKLGIVNPAGPVAAEQWQLYLVLAGVLVFVAAPVLILVPLMAWHYRRTNKGDAYRPDWGFSWPLEILVWVPPIGIVIGLALLLWSSTHRLDPYRPIASAHPPLEVQAVALDWKWLFIYPNERIATVDRLVIPAERPVHLSLTSGTVMQSLLIPRLAGQIYAMAGMRTQLNFAASGTGVFRGENTQYNGEGFPKQKFDVVALSPAEHRHWMRNVQASARPLDKQALAGLTARSIVARPASFSAVPPGLFDRIMMASTKKGAP